MYTTGIFSFSGHPPKSRTGIVCNPFRDFDMG